MDYKPGTRLRSQVCDGEFIIVRAPSQPVELRCGGLALVDLTGEPTPKVAARSGQGEQPALGKRYNGQTVELEILVTKGASFGLSADDEALVLLETKPLPSSD